MTYISRMDAQIIARSTSSFD